MPDWLHVPRQPLCFTVTASSNIHWFLNILYTLSSKIICNKVTVKDPTTRIVVVWCWMPDWLHVPRQPLYFTVTASSNIHWFLNILYTLSSKIICNKVTVKDSTTPQTCRYTTLPCEILITGWPIKTRYMGVVHILYNTKMLIFWQPPSPI